MSAIPVYLDAGNPICQLLFHKIAQLFHVFGVSPKSAIGFRSAIHQPGSLPHPHNACDVFGAGAKPTLLGAAMDERLYRDSTFAVQEPRALRPLELMGRNGKCINTEVLNIDRHMGIRLNRIRMEQGAHAVRRFGKLFYRLDGADLVVHQHHGANRGIGSEQSRKSLNVHHTVTAHRDIRNLEAMPLQPAD